MGIGSIVRQVSKIFRSSVAEDSANTPTVVIQPEHGIDRLGLREVCAYRDLIKYLVLRRIRSRYRPTNLGLLWIFITPLIYVVIYSVVFGSLFGVSSGNIPYPVFVYSGITLWFFFQGSVNRSTTSLTASRGMISKVYYPRLIVPLVAILSELVDYVASLVPLLFMFLLYRIEPGPTILFVPVFALLAILAASVLGVWLAALSVDVRDVEIALRPAFRALLYFSPVLYPVTSISEQWRPLVYLNPLACIFQGYRWALFGSEPPPISALSVTVAFLIVAWVAALIYFRRVERTMIDYL